MEAEWSKMTDEQRAEFSAWRAMKQAEAEARAQAEAQKAAEPKRYDEMTETEKRAWLRRQGILVNSGARV